MLPNNNKPVDPLNKAIKTFDKNLDDILIQLNDISLFDNKLKQRAKEREQQKHLPAKQEPTEDTQQPKTQDTQQNLASDSNGFGNNDNLLDDISNFLSTVPDSAEVNFSGDFNDNIQDLLMESDPYGGSNNDDPINFDFQNSNDQNGNIGQTNNGDLGDLNYDLDNSNVFNEIDSMLNI